jgi:LysR family transcriptional regulator for metE and metH
MTRSMEMRHLRHVQTLAAVGTLTAGGERLYLSQSALSHQLREIEDEFGVKLFRRSKKRMLLTPAGQRFLDGADVVLSEIDKVRDDISRLTSGETGTLRIAACRSLGFRWLPGVVNSFKDSYPGVEISIDSRWDHDPTSRLLAGAVNIAVTNSKTEHPGIVYLKLFDDELVAVVRSDHSWAARDYVTASAFENENLVTFDFPPNDLDVRVAVLAGTDVNPKSVITLPTIEAIVDMVQGGVGVAVLNSWPVRPFLESSDLRRVRLTRAGMQRTWYAVVNGDEPNPPYVSRFVGLLAHQGRN